MTQGGGWPPARAGGLIGKAPQRHWPLGLELLFASALGALQTQAYVHTQAWLLPLVCIALLVWRLSMAGPARAAALGWAYGTAWLAAGVWWLFISMHRYGGLHSALAALAVLALALALSLYLALACAAFARWRRGALLADSLLFGACWALAEWARATLFTGFPWVASGYSQIDSPWAVAAPWVGVHGLGVWLALMGALAGLSLAQRRWRAAGAGLACVVALALAAGAGPYEFTQPHGELRVSLIQTNVAQDEKFAAERMPEALAWLAQALRGAQGELVVAPETAIPLLPDQLAELTPGWWDDLTAQFTSGRAVALLGLPLGDFERGYTNSVAGLAAPAAGAGAASASASPGAVQRAGDAGSAALAGAPEPAVYRYNKQHLVPFGEFIPSGFRWFVALMNIPLGDFARGPLNAPSFVALGQRMAPNICYEDLFGEELAVRFVDGPQAPTLMVNISNIGWFGNSSAVPQHLHISRMRTLELQRPMLRATNTGATVIIDHRGVVTQALPPLERGVLEGQVQARSGNTPYAQWAGRYGLWPVFLLAAGVVLVMALRRR